MIGKNPQLKFFKVTFSVKRSVTVKSNINKG